MVDNTEPKKIKIVFTEKKKNPEYSWFYKGKFLWDSG